jgi:hypothetical protein
MLSLPVSDHYASTFKYFLPVCVRTLPAEQVKNTKTIPRDYMCDNGGVYRRLRHRKKCRQAIKQENFLRHWLLQTPGREIAKRRKKMNFKWYLGKIEKQRISEMFCS